MVLAVAFLPGGKLVQRLVAVDGRWKSTAIAVAAAALAIVLIVASLRDASDPTGMWVGLPISSAIVGAAFAGVTVVVFVARSRWVWASVSGFVATVALPFVLLLWVQTPGAIRDPFHFAFTSDEIAATAARHVPLSDYIPQYSVLLSYPVAAIDYLWPGHTTALTLAWLLVLQLVSIGTAIVVSVLLGGLRMAMPAGVVLIGPVVAAFSGGGLSASTYFAVLPMRVVLPVVTILAAFLVLRHGIAASRWWHWILLGLCVGVTTLNNPDYGLPAALTITVTICLVAGHPRSAWRPLVWLVTASAAVFAVYTWLGALSGHPIHWEYWLQFTLVFGDYGFGAAPVAEFGIHIAVIALFVAASATGFVLVRTSPAASWRGQQGLGLCLAGGWSLLTIPYFAGRSFAPTIVGGYAFSVGLVVACMLPMLRVGLRGLRARRADGRVNRVIGVAFVLIAVAAAAGAGVLALPPALTLGWLQSGDRAEFPPVTEQVASVERVAAANGNERLASALASGAVVQALPMSSLVATSSGLGSVSVASSDGYLTISRVFTTAQCAAPWPGNASMLLVTTPVAASLAADPSCQGYVDFRRAEEFSDGDSALYTLLPRAVLGVRP